MGFRRLFLLWSQTFPSCSSGEMRVSGCQGLTTSSPTLASRCPVMLVLGDQAPHEDAVVSRKSGIWGWVREGGGLGWWLEGCVSRRQALLGTRTAPPVQGRLIPGRKETGRGSQERNWGRGAWVPWMGEATGSVSTFTQLPPCSRLNVIQNWTPPRLLSSRSVALLHAQPDSWPPVQSHIS